jgi:uncharacterized protein YrrD
MLSPRHLAGQREGDGKELVMLCTTKSLEGYALHARDGDIGHVKDVYFDDQHWHVRYFVVDTGRWLARQVLISPEAVSGPLKAMRVIPVNLTQEQVRRSPGIDTAKPVSRQHEADLRHHYGWPPYWGVVLPEAALAPVAPLDWFEPQSGAGHPSSETRGAGTTAHHDAGDDPHLRSASEVIGYHLQAIDGAIGHVADLLVDFDSWQIRYLVIDTRNWWPGKKVILAPSWIRDVSWPESKVLVDLTRATIKGSPPYDPERAVTAGYASELHDYYGRPRYPDWDPDHKTAESRRNYRSVSPPPNKRHRA